MASTASTQRRKRVDSDPPNMKRGPQGSAFLTCDSCQASVIAAVADMHNCEGNASFKEQLAKMREEYAANHKKEEKKPKAVKTAKSPKSPKEPKAGKDPNAPKAPATPFFIFMEEFRKTYKEENGDVKGPEVAKAGGAKWKEMSDEEKKPYLEEYAKRKEEYEMKLAEYKEGKVGPGLGSCCCCRGAWAAQEQSLIWGMEGSQLLLSTAVDFPVQPLLSYHSLSISVLSNIEVLYVFALSVDHSNFSSPFAQARPPGCPS
eukprot:TRINITY_DN1630_c0_g1_i3.p1 TRINITY_DN1630_c0_g1~~TRINITY_DN1630_c0_g1_i3.p1  ORF type:complete len:260 (+),score=58.69 TRINITY_DN1630_c0_g1_i3:156-935(+)